MPNSAPAESPTPVNTLAPVASETFRNVLGHYPTGVCAITAIEPAGRPVAMLVGSFTAVSLDPPLVGFFADRRSESWCRLERCDNFCVNVLSSTQRELCGRLVARGEDKFAGLSFDLTNGGCPRLEDVVAWIDCTREAVREAGDHYLVLGRVRELEIVCAEEPMLFYRGAYGGFVPH